MSALSEGEFPYSWSEYHRIVIILWLVVSAFRLFTLFESDIAVGF